MNGPTRGQVSDYSSTSGPRAKKRGRLIRRLILVLGIIYVAMGTVWLFLSAMEMGPMGWLRAGLLGTPASAGDLGHCGKIALNAAVYLGLFLLTQWLFLLPRGSWKPKLTDTGRSMWLSAVGGAFAAMLITMGLVATVCELFGVWTTDIKDGPPMFAELWYVLLALWGMWAIVFALYARRLDHPTAVTRILRGLIAGSIMETLIALPVQAWATQKNECYCARGSYTGLVFGITVILWAFGPGIFLLMWREKHRRTPLMSDQITPGTETQSHKKML